MIKILFISICLIATMVIAHWSGRIAAQAWTKGTTIELKADRLDVSGRWI